MKHVLLVTGVMFCLTLDLYPEYNNGFGELEKINWEEDFSYNSEKEKLFWLSIPYLGHGGSYPGPAEFIQRNNDETLFSGYAKGSWKSEGIRMVYLIEDGKIIRSKWFVKNGNPLRENKFAKSKRSNRKLSTMFWNENVPMRFEEYFRNSKGRRCLQKAKSWKTNGEICPITDLSEGNGKYVIYNAAGREEMTFRNGIRNGLSTIFNYNGQKIREENWLDGKGDGLFVLQS